MSFRNSSVAECKFSLVLALSCLFGACHAGNPIIESVSPPVGQRGTEFDIRVEGEGFSKSSTLVFYSEEIECVSAKLVSEYELEATLRTSEKCPLKNHPFRVLAEHGFSDMRAIRVTPFSVMPEGKGADSTGQGKAVSIDKGVTISGVLESGDIDRYSVQLEKGQTLSAEVEAVRLGYELLDTVVTIKSPDGEVLVRCDDDALFQQDPVASIVAAEAGVYEISLHESNYKGSLTSHYALHLGSFPRPGVVYPAGGVYGQTLKVALLASDGNTSQHVVRLPAKEDAEGFELLLAGESDTSLPTPLPFRLGELRSAMEQEPNELPEEAEQVIRFPGALDGTISAPGDIDFYKIQIPESESMVCIEVFADRIGSPIDTMLRLFNRSGQLIAANDDRGSHDSRIEFKPRGQAEFWLEVSDKLKAGQANGVYRIEVFPVAAELTTFLPRPDRVSQEAQSIAIPAGNRVMKRVAVRRENLEGEVALQFSGLPQGVNASTVILAEDQFWVPAVLEADAEAPLGGGLAELVGVTGDEGNLKEGGFEQAVDLVHSTADQLFNSLSVNQLPVAVTPAIPFRVDMQSPASSLPAGGQLVVEVQVEREAGFEEPIRVRLPFLPPWVVSESHIVIPKDESTARFHLEAYSNVRADSWRLVAVAEVDALTSEGEIDDYIGREVCSQAIELETSASPIKGVFEELAAEQGKTLEAVCNLDASSLAGPFEAMLEGLPNWLTAEVVTVAVDQKQFAFKILIPEDSPTGKFTRLQCRLKSQNAESQVSYVVAADTTITILEPNKLKRDSSGRLLSPLEALRTND